MGGTADTGVPSLLGQLASSRLFMETQEDVASGYGKIIALLSAARVVPLRMRLRVPSARKVFP